MEAKKGILTKVKELFNPKRKVRGKQCNAFSVYRQKAEKAYNRYMKVITDLNIEKDESLREHVERLREPFEKGYFTLVILGKMSAGKSTFINALLGEEILPAGIGQTTRALTEIFASSDKDEKLLTITFEDGKSTIYKKDEVRTQLKKLAAIPDEYAGLPVNFINEKILEGKNKHEIMAMKKELTDKAGRPLEDKRIERYIDNTNKKNIPKHIRIDYPLLDFDGWRIIDTPGVEATGGIQDRTYVFIKDKEHEPDAVLFIHSCKENIEDSGAQTLIKGTIDELTTERESDKIKDRTFFVLTQRGRVDFEESDLKFDNVKKCYTKCDDFDNGILPEHFFLVDSLAEQVCQKIVIEDIDAHQFVLGSDKYNEGHPNAEDIAMIMFKIKRKIEKSSSELCTESCRKGIEEMSGFDTLREKLNMFVKEVKRSTFEELIKAIKEDLKEQKKKKGTEEKLLKEKLSNKDFDTLIAVSIKQLDNYNLIMTKNCRELETQYDTTGRESESVKRYGKILEELCKIIYTLNDKSTLRKAYHDHYDKIDDLTKKISKEICEAYQALSRKAAIEINDQYNIIALPILDFLSIEYHARIETEKQLKRQFEKEYEGKTVRRGIVKAWRDLWNLWSNANMDIKNIQKDIDQIISDYIEDRKKLISAIPKEFSIRVKHEISVQIVREKEKLNELKEEKLSNDEIKSRIGKCRSEQACIESEMNAIVELLNEETEYEC